MPHKKVAKWIKKQYGHVLASLEKKSEPLIDTPINPQFGLCGAGKTRAAEFSEEELLARELRRKKSRNRANREAKRRRSNQRETIRHGDTVGSL
jgi:hypothetical protein